MIGRSRLIDEDVTPLARQEDSFRPADVLAIPPLGAGMERYVHRRGVGLAPYLRNAAVRARFPRNLRLARGDGAADVVGNVFRKRRACVNRPTAEIERIDI